MSRALLAVVALLTALVVPVQASGEASITSSPPPVAAAAWYLVGSDGAVLAEHAERAERAPASITKLMTAIVTLRHARLSDVVEVSQLATRVGQSTADLRPDEDLTVGQLLRAMLVPSANDAAEALALYVGRGSQDRFVALMNGEARRLGLTDTTFENPHGLDQHGHVTSARDATRLVRYALGIPVIREALQHTRVTLPGGRELVTTDDLLRTWPPLVAGKTGHTRHAGWNEAAAASEDGALVYGAVLGARSRAARNQALQSLLSYGLSQYVRVVAIDGLRTYARATTGYGRGPVPLVARRTRLTTIRIGRPLVERVVAPSSVALPVRKGQSLGQVAVFDGARLVAREQLVAGRDVSAPGLLGTAGWYVRRTAANLWGIVS